MEPIRISNRISNAIFYEDKVIIDDLKVTTLYIDDIDFTEYTKPTFFSCLFASVCRPGYLFIYTKRKKNGQEVKGLKSVYLIKIKYEEMFKIPDCFKPSDFCR